MIKNIIFDLGGVVLGRSFELSNGDVSPFSFIHGDQQFPEFWKEFDRGTITQWQVAEAIASLGGCTAQEADRMITSLGTKFNEYPETVELIEELHRDGYGLYVLSNMPFEFWDEMKTMPVFSLFEGIVISSLEGMTKPDPAFFRLLLDRYGLEASETLFIDDKRTNTTAAADLGLKVCVFNTATGADDVRILLKELNEGS